MFSLIKFTGFLLKYCVLSKVGFRARFSSYLGLVNEIFIHPTVDIHEETRSFKLQRTVD